MIHQKEMKIFGWPIFTSVMISSNDRRMEKLLVHFWYRWSMHPGSSHHQMEDIQPQILSCSTDYMKNLFHLQKSMLWVTRTWVHGISTLPPQTRARRRKADFFLPKECRFLCTRSQVAGYMLYWSRANTTEAGKSILN